ncbi:MAG: hypothetical protein HOP29_19320 [Phycisphaerales bacterium]|nr:hypothetical protein [Phycisphaerales bacterium]
MSSTQLCAVGSRVVGLCVAFVVPSASAVIVSYDDRATFDIDAPGTELVDFQFTGTPLEVTGSGFLLRPDPFDIPDYDIDINGASEDLYLLGPAFATGAIVGLTINGPYNTADGTTYLKSGFEGEFLFGGGGVTAFGIDVFTLLDPSSPLSVTVYVESATGDPLFEDEFPLDTFVGFVSDEPIGLITFGLVGVLTEGESALGFDNMSFMSAAGCVVPGDCDDGNECTDDDCVANACVYTDNTNPCDDADPCTVGDVCSGGMCTGTPVDCSDFNLCTDEVCIGGTCQFFNNTNPCDDADTCTVGDICSGGMCAGTPIVCDDMNVCTDDECIGGVCVFTDNTSPCDDADPCTVGDVCSGGMCAGAPIVCDDMNVCTDDGCVGGACVFTNNTVPCNDGNICTTTDTCSGGVCGGTAVDCSSLNNSCNVGVCNTMTGMCVAQPTNENGPCSDSNACSLGDHCVSGACVSNSNVDCSALNTVCKTFSCLPSGAPGNCGIVTPQTGLPCNDGNPCTNEDGCTPAGICAGQPIPGCVVDPPPNIPTVSQWGLFALLLAGLSMGTITFGRRTKRNANA